MKKKLLIFRLFLLLIPFAFIVSCSSDSDEDDDGVEVIDDPDPENPDEEEDPENQPPNAFSLVTISSGATNVEIRPGFIWEPATDPDSENIVYDLYIGTQNPPGTVIVSDIATTTYTLQSDLNFNTLYYWRVVAKDSDGNSTSSSTSNFTTREGTLQELLIGTWKVESVESDGEGFLSTDCKQQSTFIFSENETGEHKEYVNNNNDCVYYINSSFTYEIDPFDDEVFLEYSYEDMGQDYFDLFIIQSIDENELVFKTSYTYPIDAIYTLSKQ